MKQIFILFLLWFGLSLSAQDQISLLFVGDLMQHQAQIDAARQGDGYNYNDCFRNVKKEISEADMAIGNLEVTLGGKPYRGYPVFSAPDEYLYAIKEAGFDVLLTANNHCLDKGKLGLERTILMLDSLKIHHAGTYRNPEERHRNYPLLIEKNGFRIVLLNYTYGTNGLKTDAPNMVNYINREQIKKDILDARRKLPDVIIACMHWGVEDCSFPERSERELAGWLIGQGVDHVIGSHPHVLQPMEIVKDSRTPARHVIVYSLGNFISNMSKEKTDGGAMVRLKLQRICRITRLVNCEYALVWTSRPVLSKKKNFELYPVTFINKSIHNEELNVMKRFLKGTENLLGKSNGGIKEYFFE